MVRLVANGLPKLMDWTLALVARLRMILFVRGRKILARKSKRY